MKRSLPIYLAVEDELSEWVVRRALSTRRVEYAIGAVFGREGFGYLKRQARAFNNAARRCPFLLLTDLDQCPCPAQLIEEWLGQPRHPHLLLRVAVHEVETWLLGDSAGLSAFLGLRRGFVCDTPEQLLDPKQTLLGLAVTSPRRSTREGLVSADESSGRLVQGPDYNGTLARFVTEKWDIVLARGKCRSLDGLFVALDRMEAEASGK